MTQAVATAPGRTPVFIALQATEVSRSIVDAIVADNPLATVTEYPAMVKIDVPGRLVIRRESVEDRLGRSWDLQELHLNLISLSGHIDETDDEFSLQWNTRA
jgi:phenol hydroxylase P2 protein